MCNLIVTNNTCHSVLLIDSSLGFSSIAVVGSISVAIVVPILTIVVAALVILCLCKHNSKKQRSSWSPPPVYEYPVTPVYEYPVTPVYECPTSGVGVMGNSAYGIATLSVNGTLHRSGIHCAVNLLNIIHQPKFKSLMIESCMAYQRTVLFCLL